MLYVIVLPTFEHPEKRGTRFFNLEHAFKAINDSPFEHFHFPDSDSKPLRKPIQFIGVLKRRSHCKNINPAYIYIYTPNEKKIAHCGGSTTVHYLFSFGVYIRQMGGF